MTEDQPNEQDGVVDENRTLPVTEPLLLEDGKHSGVITKVIYRESPYSYVDIYIKPDDSDLELKAGYPQMVSPNSALGKLLTNFKVDLVKGDEVNPHKTLMGKRVEFVTITEPVKMKDGRMRDFSRIVRESVKPGAEKAPEAGKPVN